MKTTLLTLNSPNLNGRIYTTEAIQRVISRYKESGKPLLVQHSISGSINVNLENVIGEVVSLEVKDDVLIGDLKLFPGKDMFYSLSCRPSFIGKTNEDGEVDMETLELISFGMTCDPA